MCRLPLQVAGVADRGFFAVDFGRPFFAEVEEADRAQFFGRQFDEARPQFPDRARFVEPVGDLDFFGGQGRWY